MSEPQTHPPTLSYAQGDFDKPPRTWTALRNFDLLAVVYMALLNGAMFADLLEKVRTPPTPPPPPFDQEWTAVAPWQFKAALCDTALSIALLGLLLAAVWAMRKPATERRAVRLHYVYVGLKLTLVLTTALVWGWSVDKASMEWSNVASSVMVGVFHPMIVLALLRQVGKELRARRGAL